MGYLDGLADTSFKQDSLGRWIFYPLGALGKGYYLKGDEHQATLKNSLKKNYMVLFPLCILAPLINLWICAGLGIVYVLGYIIFIKNLTKDLNRTPDRLKLP